MRAFGQVVRVHGIPPCARSSKRAGGFIPRIALDQCRDPERYRTRVPLCPHSSMHQSGRILSVRLLVRIQLGTPCGCGSTAECGRAKAETTVRLRSPAPFWSEAKIEDGEWPDARARHQVAIRHPLSSIFVSKIALKALLAMRSLGKRISPVQFRVRAPFRNRASAQAGIISQLSRGQHSGLRPFASTQQPADFFCKEFLSERHRLEAPSTLLA